MDLNRLLVKDPDVKLEIFRWLRVANSVATRFKWIFIYYFVIMVRNLKVRLEASDPRDLNKKLRRYSIENAITFSIFIICQIGIVTINILEYLSIVKKKENERLYT